jgi:hypothetical protein
MMDAFAIGFGLFIGFMIVQLYKEKRSWNQYKEFREEWEEAIKAESKYKEQMENYRVYLTDEEAKKYIVASETANPRPVADSGEE